MRTLPSKCLRGDANCQPLSQIASDDGSTFVCCGTSCPDSRSVEGDFLRHCFKSVHTDSIFDMDELDALDVIEVLTCGMSMAKRLPAMKRSVSESKKAGGHARAASLTPERRSEIARGAANKRWGNI